MFSLLERANGRQVRLKDAHSFFGPKESALGPKGAELIASPAPKHPVDVQFSPDGRALYVADLGALSPFLAGAGPFPRDFPVPRDLAYHAREQ